MKMSSRFVETYNYSVRIYIGYNAVYTSVIIKTPRKINYEFRIHQKRRVFPDKRGDVVSNQSLCRYIHLARAQNAFTEFRAVKDPPPKKHIKRPWFIKSIELLLYTRTCTNKGLLIIICCSGLHRDHVQSCGIQVHMEFSLFRHTFCLYIFFLTTTTPPSPK